MTRHIDFPFTDVATNSTTASAKNSDFTEFESSGSEADKKSKSSLLLTNSGSSTASISGVKSIAVPAFCDQLSNDKARDQNDSPGFNTTTVDDNKKLIKTKDEVGSKRKKLCKLFGFGKSRRTSPGFNTTTVDDNKKLIKTKDEVGSKRKTFCKLFGFGKSRRTSSGSRSSRGSKGTRGSGSSGSSGSKGIGGSSAGKATHNSYSGNSGYGGYGRYDGYGGYGRYDGYGGIYPYYLRSVTRPSRSLMLGDLVLTISLCLL